MKWRFHDVGWMVVLATVYFLAGKYNLSPAEAHPKAVTIVAALWPPCGIALAALLLWGIRLWPGVFIGAFLAYFTMLGSLSAALPIAAGCTVQTLTAAWLVNRLAAGRQAFERLRSATGFVVMAAVFSTLICATVGTTTLCLTGYSRLEEYPANWLTWWLANMTSDLVITPLLVLWLARPKFHWRWSKVLETAALSGTIVLVGIYVFLGRSPNSSIEQMEYLALPPLLWATFRFGMRGAVTALFFICGFALHGTLLGLGPFAMPDQQPSLSPLAAFMGIHMFMVIVSGGVLLLNAIVQERQQARKQLLLLNRVGQVLLEAADADEAASKTLGILCEETECEAGMVWMADQATKQLSCVNVWHSRSFRAAEFRAAARQARLAPGSGLPERVWLNGQPGWETDLTKWEGNTWRSTVLKAGLHTAFGFPLRREGAVVGVLEGLCRGGRLSDQDLLRSLAIISGELEKFGDRKQAESRLRESELRFRQMADNIHEVFWMTDPDKSEILYVSPAYEEIWGRTCASLYAAPKSWLEAIHPDERERVMTASLARQKLGGYDQVYRITRPDGSWRWIHDQAFPVHDHSGNVYRIVGVAEDITGQKLAETRMAVLAQAVESTEELIALFDLENRFTFVNRAFQRTFGYSEAEVLGKTSDLLHARQNLPGFAAEIMSQVRQGGWQGELLNRKKDGGEFPVVLVKSPIKDSLGQNIGFISVARDVSEQKRLEKEILGISARERRRVSYDLHDGLSQHLAGVALKTKLLADALASSGDGTHASSARTIVDLVNDSIRQTRQLARNLDPVEAESNNLVSALDRLALETNQATQVECLFTCNQAAAELPPQTGSELFRIAQEAVRNALKHGNPTRIAINLRVTKETLDLVIQDNGTGFDPARNPSGDEMGLRIMRYRAAAIGGYFTLSSQPGEGTVVRCALGFRNPGSRPDKEN